MRYVVAEINCYKGPAISAHNSSSSMTSLASHGSVSNHLRRPRGQRSYSAASMQSELTTASLTPDGGRRYSCTFGCSAAFTRKSDWKRHETTIHMPRRLWICVPTFPVSGEDGSKLLECHFCGEIFLVHDDNTPEMMSHLSEKHHYLACAAKAEKDRTFTRKDKLMQHLEQVHKQEIRMTPRQTAWVRCLNEDAIFACPFCAMHNLSWDQRADHIAVHFEDGTAWTIVQSADTLQSPSIDLLF